MNDNLPDDVWIRTAIEGDAEMIATLWCARFGTPMETARELVDKWLNIDSAVCYCAVIDGPMRGDDIDGCVVGFGIAAATPDVEYVRNSFDPMAYGLEVSELTVILQMGCVNPLYEGKGIGEALFARRMQWAREMGAEMVTGAAWQRPGDVPKSSIFFERHGFETQGTSAEYFDDERECPDCYPDECDCEATLYVCLLSPEERSDPADAGVAWPEEREWNVRYETVERSSNRYKHEYPTPGDWELAGSEGLGLFWRRPTRPKPESEYWNDHSNWEPEQRAMLVVEYDRNDKGWLCFHLDNDLLWRYPYDERAEYWDDKLMESVGEILSRSTRGLEINIRKHAPRDSPERRTARHLEENQSLDDFA